MNKLVIIFLAVGVSAVPSSLFAHHGNASYDETKMVTVKGTVTAYMWQNPHVLVRVDAKNDAGETVHWVMEASSTVSETASGWNRTTFKPGDEVILEVAQLKNGNPAGRFKGGKIVINGIVFKQGVPGQ